MDLPHFNMVGEAFSYDEIYDILRTEKFGAELQLLAAQIRVELVLGNIL